MKNKLITKLSMLVGLVFFVVSLLTLTDYGINWDTINHLPRGQAYLHYFLTGNKDYSDLPKYFDGWQKPGQWYFQDPDYLSIKSDLPDNKVPSRSLYQVEDMNLDYFLKSDGDGHPPLSDIFSAFFNEVLFRRLKLVNDVDSYRIFGVAMASVAVALVFYWSSSLFGVISGLVSVFAISLYPLFWAESHFNTEKDIPETAFWTLFMYSFWKGITTKSWKWILITGVFFGLALGTKLNIIFACFIIIPWFILYLFKNKGFTKNIKAFLKKKKLISSLLLIPVIGVGILILTWPYLWADPVGGILRMVGYYKTIGTTRAVSYAFLGVNTFAVKWILYTTPIVTLALTATGLLLYIFNFKKDKNGAVLLFLLWFIVPIARVTAPGSNVYGGVRQIMEFIPAMALLSGYAFSYLAKKINKKTALVTALIIFVPILVKIISIHPNENVYFNNLIGGLSGAKKQDIKYWGFSFGSPYRQAASWLNKNAPKDAKLVYTYDLIPNLPRIWLRTDINLYNALRSGYLREGEYAMGLVYDGTAERSYYDTYLEKYIKPVFEAKVDDVAILKIWKNDDEHLVKGYKDPVSVAAKYKKDKNNLVFNLGGVKNLSRLEIKYNQTRCSSLKSGLVSISQDGNVWQTVGGYLPDDWRVSSAGEQPKDGSFIEPFVGQKAAYIKLTLDPIDTCLLNVRSFKVFIFD